MTPGGAPKAVTEFERNTLPWIDRKDADIDGFVKRYERAKSLPYDLAEKMKFWQKNGYVILDQAIATTWLDQLWSEVEELIEEIGRASCRERVCSTV